MERELDCRSHRLCRAWPSRRRKRGATGEVTLDDGTRLNAKALKDLKDGEVVHVNLPGGGGYGEPWKRDVEKVRWDVVENYISVEEAEQQYGVAVRYSGNAA